jgi:hypothetical protein
VTQLKNKRGQTILRMIIKRRVNDAIDFHIIFLPLMRKLKSKHMSNVEKWLNRIITIATAILALLNYILAHWPKLSVIVLLFTVNSVFAQTKSYRIYPIKCTQAIWPKIKDTDPLKSSVLSTGKDSVTFLQVDSSFWFGPSVSFDLYTREVKTGAQYFGLLPGIGYGAKWNPYNWKDLYLLGFDLFFDSGFINDNLVINAKYLSIQVVPVFSILKYVHLGYGYRWNYSLSGLPNRDTPILVFGASFPLL